MHANILQRYISMRFRWYCLQVRVVQLGFSASFIHLFWMKTIYPQDCGPACSISYETSARFIKQRFHNGPPHWYFMYHAIFNSTYVYVSDEGIVWFHISWYDDPSKATMVELNIDITISSTPSPLMSVRTGGTMIPLSLSSYMSLACESRKRSGSIKQKGILTFT